LNILYINTFFNAIYDASNASELSSSSHINHQIPFSQPKLKSFPNRLPKPLTD